MTMEARTARGETVVELAGSFDASEAAHLCTLLLELEPERPVVLDFHRVRELHDSAVALVAHDLRQARRRVALLGLSEHHHRLLRYMGVSRGPDPATHA